MVKDLCHVDTNLKLVFVLIFKQLDFSYIGSKKSETAPESQPAAAPWSGSSLSGCKRRAAGRPEPLWRPACEEEEKASPSSEDSKPSVSKPSQGDSSPPSPRTLEAIQAAMNDGSDEEQVNQEEKDGSASPRTLLAIQQALAEEEDGAAEHRTLINSSQTKLQANIHHPVPRVVISSSEEETEPDDVNFLPHEKSDFKWNPTGQSLHVKDSLFVSSSEEEMEEMIGQRNKTLRFAALQKPHEREMKSGEETKKGQLTEDVRKGSTVQTETREELERKESDHRLITKNRDLVQPQAAAAASNQNTLSINLSAQICGKPLSADTEIHPGDVKSEGSEESESEGKVIIGLRSHSQ